MSKGAKGKDKDSHHKHHLHHKGESRSSNGASGKKTPFVGVIIIAGVLVLLYLFKGQVWGDTSGHEGGGGNSNFATKLEVDQLRSLYLNDTMSVASFATFVAVWLAITIFCLAWMVAYVKRMKTKTAANQTHSSGGGGVDLTSNYHVGVIGTSEAQEDGGFFTRYWNYFGGIRSAAGGLKRAVFSTDDKRNANMQKKNADAAPPVAAVAAAPPAAPPVAAPVAPAPAAAAASDPAQF
jgi:hypothetical protein